MRFLNAATGKSASGVLQSLQPGVRVALEKLATYVLTSTERDDLAYGAEADHWFGFAKLGSSGPDNVLTLVVRVIPDRVERAGIEPAISGLQSSPDGSPLVAMAPDFA